MGDYSAILNDALDISGIDHTFTFSNGLLTPEIYELLKKTYRRDIFVICKDRKTARRLLDEMVRCLIPSIDKVDRMQYIVYAGYDVWTFISKEELVIKLKGRHRTEVVWDWDFEKALDIYKEKQK